MSRQARNPSTHGADDGVLIWPSKPVRWGENMTTSPKDHVGLKSVLQRPSLPAHSRLYIRKFFVPFPLRFFREPFASL